MTFHPLVSIIMNCHNSDKYLKEAIDSVYNQSYTSWEIIFWNNKSTDNSKNIALSYDNKIQYFESESFLNLGDARNKACKKARGKYIAFLDCDDYWLHDKLEKQVKLFEDSKDMLGLVYGRTIYYSEFKKKQVKRHQPTLDGHLFDKLMNNNFISFASAIILKEKYFEIGGFPTHLKHSTDFWIFLKLAKKYPFKAIKVDCCVHRLHENNLTKKYYITGVQEGIEVLRTFPPSRKIDIAIKRMLGRICFRYIIQGKLIQFMILLIKKKLLFVMLQMILEKFLKSAI